jgi:N-acetylneuraminic acid mutarotase
LKRRRGAAVLLALGALLGALACSGADDHASRGPDGDAASPDGGGAPLDGAVDAAARDATWSSLASLPVAQQETAVVAAAGRVYVLGGFLANRQTTPLVHVYDPAADTWSTTTPLPEPLHHVNAAVIEDKIWITGALRGASFGPTGETYVFDPAAPGAGWVERTPMPEGKERGASLVAAIGTKIYVAGGLRDAAVSDFSAYDTVSDTWEDLPALTAPRDHGAGAAALGFFFAIGGRSSALGGHTELVEAYDPSARTWSARAPLPTSRAGFAAATARGLFLVIGGEGNRDDARGMFAEVEAYDPAADTWSILPSMRTPRHGMGAATVGDVVYVPGGGVVEGFGATEIVEALSL